LSELFPLQADVRLEDASTTSKLVCSYDELHSKYPELMFTK